ncbi:MAG: hypothetical protein LBB58_04195, partial [Cellulomonadaceae bacterium]|nr:hypothetical protein [Cellulomonadaceae bacterium]
TSAFPIAVKGSINSGKRTSDRTISIYKVKSLTVRAHDNGTILPTCTLPWRHRISNRTNSRYLEVEPVKTSEPEVEPVETSKPEVEPVETHVTAWW